MKLKFKVQPYQTQAVDAVMDCLAGQMNTAGIAYRIGPGVDTKCIARGATLPSVDIEQTGFKNTEIQLADAQVLANIQSVQKRQNLIVSKSLDDFHVAAKNEYNAAPESYKTAASKICPLHLDIEMETGTGKTYCYIKTIFELHKLYGWSKFIIVVPSIAIREGVLKSLAITAEHFTESYGKKARFFAYNSKQLHHLESFSSDAGVNVMVINIQAFNATGKDNRRIYDELDDFQSRRPIDVISSNRPIVILDEPQKMEGTKTLEALAKFRPLMIIRYSATHRTTHNKIHRLDALDAYNQKLVKKIAVRGIAVKGLAGSSAYLYLESIEISKKAPVARIEIEIKQASGLIKPVTRRLKTGDNLFDISNNLEEYRGYVISEIDARTDTVEFTNGHILNAGDATGNVHEAVLRRIQIRETIYAHLQKEKQLYPLGIKVLSLFFIDEVAKYRDYSQENDMGEYARIFEEEYKLQVTDFLDHELHSGYEAYRAFLGNISASNTHNGYFSIDKTRNRLINPSVKQRGEEKGFSDDVDAYDLILKDKESLLSLPLPSDDSETRRKREVRFIFSHSALREGWDNPNVFTMCMLKHSDNTISRRQEVGRGLRISVNQQGDRMDNTATVHDVNVLTVVASESYKDFVGNLQREISESLSGREGQLPLPDDDRTPKKNPLNDNFNKQAFKELWGRINRKAVYRVDFDSTELIQHCIKTLDKELQVTPLQYTIQSGIQGVQVTDAQLKSGDGFVLTSTTVETHTASIHSHITYDLLAKIGESTQLTRQSIAAILRGVKAEVFHKFRQNPEHFIAESSRIINEQKATMIIERLSYDSIAAVHDIDIFTAGQSKQDFVNASAKLKKHIYDYAITDSKVERDFVTDLDTSTEVVVYAKLPRGFFIPTPVGNYNPDWAIAFHEGAVKHIYLVAETKGALSSMELRAVEKTQIECARKFFAELNRKIDHKHVKYDVVNSYGKLMELVGAHQ